MLPGCKSPLCAAALCSAPAASGVAERRSCCHGNFESCLCFPLCQQLWRNRTHWSKFFLGHNCSAMLRCLAVMEAGTAAEVNKKEEASFSLPKPLAELASNRAHLEIHEYWGYWAIVFFSQGLCFSSSLQEEVFKGVLSCYRNRKMWKWKLFCKGQPEQGAGLTFMSFRSSSELLLCYTQWRNLEGTRQFWFIVLFTCLFFFGSSTCSIPLWAILL